MKAYIGKHIEFTELAETGESDFDQGMRAKVVGAVIHHEDSDDPYWELIVDCSFWQEYNKQFSKPNYYNSNGDAVLKWHETNLYPSNHITSIYYAPNSGTLFNILPLAEIEEKANNLLVVIHKLISEGNIIGKWHNDHALQEIMKFL